MNISEMIRRAGMARAYEFLEKDPEENIPKLAEWMGKGGLAALAQNSPWFRLAGSLWRELDQDVRKTLFTNLAINGSCWKKTSDIVWAWIDGDRDFDELDASIERGKCCGEILFLLDFSKNLKRWQELIALCNKHAECIFLALIDAELATTEFALEALRVKNLVPVLAAEEGAARACDILGEKKLLYGVQSESEEREVELRYFAERGVKLFLYILRNSKECIDINKECHLECVKIAGEPPVLELWLGKTGENDEPATKKD